MSGQTVYRPDDARGPTPVVHPTEPMAGSRTGISGEHEAVDAIPLKASARGS